MASGKDIKAGRAYVELGVGDRMLAGLRKAQARLRAFGASVGKMGRKLTGLASAMALPMGAGLKVYADFERQMAQVSTMLDRPEDHMKRFTDGVRRMSVEFGESTEALAGGLYDILSASVAPGKALDVLAVAARAAKAGLTDTKTAADAITTILNSYGLAAEDAGKVSDWMSTLEGEAPDPWQDLARKSCRVEPHGDAPGYWLGIATYVAPEDVEQDPGESTYRFNTGGGSQHITTSLQTTSYSLNPNAPDYKGAIGVTKDAVEGVDIVVPRYEWSETHTIAAAYVTQAYKMKLMELTGKTNNAAWQGYAADEVLFLGAEGAKRGDGDWDITFNFAAGKNKTGITIAGMNNVAKKAWEYLWVRYEDKEDTTAKALVKQPVAVYVEKVYESGDFGDLEPAIPP